MPSTCPSNEPTCRSRSVGRTPLRDDARVPNQVTTTVRSELATAEAAFCWALCLVLSAVVVATTAELWAVPVAIALVVLLLWLPIAWSLRRVTVDDRAVTEVRFWPIRRSWPVDSVEGVRLAPWDVGMIGLPATRVEMDVAGTTVWFPTLQAWALTRASRRRAMERVEQLASRIGVPSSDTTETK